MGDLNFGWDNPERAKRLMQHAARNIETNELDDRSGSAWRDNLIREASRNCDERFPVIYREAKASHPYVASWVRRFRTLGPAAAPWLVMAGPVGTGKSHQAYGAIREAVTHPVLSRANHFRNVSWRAMSYIEFKAAVSPTRGRDCEAEFQRIEKTELLLIDDLATGKDSEWSEQQIGRLVDYRYNHLLPTILTTNATSEQLEASVGDRVWSRIEQRCVTVVDIQGHDRRKAAVR